MKRFFRYTGRVVSTTVIILSGILLLLTLLHRDTWTTMFDVVQAKNQAVASLKSYEPSEKVLLPTATTAPTAAPSPTATKEEIPTPSPIPTLEETVIVIEPTLPVETKLLNEEFAKLHIPAEQMVGVSFKTVTRTTIVGGRETSVTSQTPQLVSSNGCNDFTQRDAVALVYLMSKKFGQSFKFTGPLIGSESAFIFYEHDGPNGECVANQNNAGAPAYCAGQIYQPNGAGGQTHPEFDLYPTGAEPRASLQDPVYCMAASMKVFRDDFGGNSILAAANYKGFGSTSDPDFVNNYIPWFNGGSVAVDGITIPFVDDDNLIRSLLGPEIDKWSASIEDFYNKMPGFYGN